MKPYLLSVLLIIIIFTPLLSSSQNQQQQSNPPQDKYQIIKTKNSEQFVLPYTVSNDDRKNPMIYTYDESKSENWILTILNNLSYAIRPDAKTIVKLQESAPSEKFIEIAMFGDVSKKFWVAINTNETGYMKLYDESGTNGWSKEQPIIIAHGNNQGLTVTNGKRIVIDKLSLDGFTLGSIVVYGKDNSDSLLNTYGGDLSFNVIYGNPAESPLYYLPVGMLVGVGGLVIGLVIFKKRKPLYNEDDQKKKS
ncbi:MAG TPA: hypothetical protein VE548_00320 [Nitrososphaeraceae archaeon]|jgi:hypothetical protein|nr:hypothetical protein [Nitrososphaeraceae archaeon]